MFGTGVWIGIALIVGFYLGATLMSLLNIARDGARGDLGRLPLNAHPRRGPARAARAGRTA